MMLGDRWLWDLVAEVAGLSLKGGGVELALDEGLQVLKVRLAHQLFIVQSLKVC
jgi:hypothetical protein